MDSTFNQWGTLGRRKWADGGLGVAKRIKQDDACAGSSASVHPVNHDPKQQRVMAENGSTAVV
jgi:hypothetical protein